MQRSLSALLLASLVLVMILGSVSDAGAQTAPPIRIYKVTYSAKASLRPATVPRGNSFRHTGYVIYNIQNPAQSVTVELLPQRRFQTNGPMLGNVVPSSVGLFTFDRTGNGVIDTEFSFIGLSGATASRTAFLRGPIPARGFRVGLVPFNNASRSLTYAGRRFDTLNFQGFFDVWNLTGKWRIDGVLNRTTPATVTDGVTLVQAHLLGRRFTSL